MNQAARPLVVVLILAASLALLPRLGLPYSPLAETMARLSQYGYATPSPTAAATGVASPTTTSEPGGPALCLYLPVILRSGVATAVGSTVAPGQSISSCGSRPSVTTTPGASPSSTILPAGSATATTAAPTATVGSSSTPAPSGTATSAPTATETATATESPMPTASATTAATMTPTEAPEDFEDRVIELTNEERAKAGCPEVDEDSDLREAAEAHSQDMAFNDFFSHTGSNGSTPSERVASAGYEAAPGSVAENIGAGYATPEQVVQGWMESTEGHRENILNCSHEEIGVGYVYLENDTGNETWQHYWTQVFAQPAD